MADATARILDVAVVARDQMNMQMKDRLAGRGAAVDADVVAVWAMSLFNFALCQGKRVAEGVPLVRGRLEPGLDVTPRYEQGVPWGYGECIPEPGYELVLMEESVCRSRAKRAGLLVHRNILGPLSQQPMVPDCPPHGALLPCVQSR